MKALKTVAVALGITLAALIVIPLIVLAGLFVWLKVTEEREEDDPRARPRRRLTHRRPFAAAHDRPPSDARRARRAGRRPVRRGPWRAAAGSGRQERRRPGDRA